MKTRMVFLIGVFMLLAPVFISGDEQVNISVINMCDIYIVNPDLEMCGGFSCVIVTPEMKILFNTGYYYSGPLIISNMEKMNIDPEDIEIVVISSDQLEGGLTEFLKRNANVKVYIPTGFPEFKIKKIEQYGVECHEVDEFTEISEKVYSTGAFEGNYIGSVLMEQALVLDTGRGLAVIVGYASPGILNILKRVKAEIPDKKIYLVMGGFNLSDVYGEELQSIIKELKRLGVKIISPSYSSGDAFRELAKEKYKKNCIEGGVGQVISF